MSFFDEICNDLEKYLIERGFIENMIRNKILRARVFPRHVLLEIANNQGNQNKVTFNVTYPPAPVFWDVRQTLEEFHVILGSDDGQKKVCPDVPVTGFRMIENLKVQLVI